MGTEGLGPNFWVGTIMMLVSQLSAVVNSKTMQNVSRACGPNLPINPKKIHWEFHLVENTDISLP